MENNFLLEEYNLKASFAPVDMNTAAITGARISLAKGQRCTYIVTMGTSVAAVAAFTLRQHNAASAGTSKDLVVANRYYVKADTATVFTAVDPVAAVAAYDLSTTFAAVSGIVVFEILSEDLDVSNGFTHFSVDVADSTAAKLASANYILGDCNFLPAYNNAI